MKSAMGRLSALLLVALSVAGCKPITLGLPRVHVSATSPDGRFTATVRNHPAIDPPDQSLWLGPTGGSARMLCRLSADQDWCDTIVWARDGSLVGFLIQDARLLVACPSTGQVVFDTWLVDRSDGYPPARKVAEVGFLPDGSGVAFRPCPRLGGDCGALQTARLAMPAPDRGDPGRDAGK
ncbi:MAG TPA: hypothetical protein PLS53_10430 [Thermoanaerobaculaceae bacterium]|nr:hypothetical protein [Thermoanaerobaculaceae bacterium]